jgi:ferredoxin/flavodoxin---NADP+ reductase
LTTAHSSASPATLRLAVVGAGPAGIYASDTLLKAEKKFDVSIDLFDHLPAPFGLVRYGVAPDHPRIKGVVSALRSVLDRGDVRLFGNVRYGVDLTLDDLKRHYNAVIFATGAVEPAALAIPGIDLPGSFGAAQFVSWYDGHPDVPRHWPLTHKEVAVIGNGNVALDVARMLAKHAEDLLPTDVPPNVYETLAASPITDVHILGRRGPMQVRFTPLELRELGELTGVEMVLHDEDFEMDAASQRAIDTNKQVFVLNRIMNAWRGKSKNPAATRRIHLHFYARPLEILGDTSGITALRYERTRPDGAGGVTGTGDVRELGVQAVYRAIGYFGSPLPGIPFDDKRGVIPNREGQVLDDHDQVVPGVYATGWIKRGPVGLIGSTKSDALETVKHLLHDQADWWNPERPQPEAIVELLESRGVRYTTLDGWHALDAHEVELGRPQGRDRVKVVPREDMVRLSRDAQPGSGRPPR